MCSNARVLMPWGPEAQKATVLEVFGQPFGGKGSQFNFIRDPTAMVHAARKLLGGPGRTLQRRHMGQVVGRGSSLSVRAEAVGREGEGRQLAPRLQPCGRGSAGSCRRV